MSIVFLNLAFAAINAGMFVHTKSGWSLGASVFCFGTALIFGIKEVCS
jgi:hypothetical protein